MTSGPLASQDTGRSEFLPLDNNISERVFPGPGETILSRETSRGLI